MNKKRKLAVVSALLALMLALGTFGGVTVLASPSINSNAEVAALSPASETLLPANDNVSSTPTSSQPPVSSGGLEVSSYSTHISGAPVTKITPGMQFSLVLKLHETRFGAHVNGSLDLPSLVQPRGKMNSSAFTPVDQNAIGTGGGVHYSNGGVDYQMEFIVTYQGKGNSFQADIYYEGAYADIAPLTSVNISLNNVVETKESSSTTSDTSSKVVRGTGFALKESSYGSGKILAGQEFPLTITMLATNGADNVENVSATLIPDQQFTLASGTSTIYFGTAKPNQSIPLTFNMKAAADAKDGSYKITLKLHGVSARTGEAVDTTVELSIPIAQPDRLVVNNFSPPDFISAGIDDGTGLLTANIVNMGKSDISNVLVTVEGKGIYTTEDSSYLGTFAPGAQNSADFTLMSDTPGQYEAVMVISYENARGEANELREKFTVEVGEGTPVEPIPPFPEDVPTENTGMPTWGWLLIALGVVAVVVAVVAMVVRKRKKAKEAELEDEDDAAI